MNTPYTPGPWRFHLGNGKNPKFHIQTQGGYQIASTQELIAPKNGQSDINLEHDKALQANACLIAAAPDMLKALQAIHAALMYCPEYGAFFTDETGAAYPAGTTYQPFALAREAIAKATGRAL